MRDVRTNDDTLITVKLMLFYELQDVNVMVCDMAVWQCGSMAEWQYMYERIGNCIDMSFESYIYTHGSHMVSL